MPEEIGVFRMDVTEETLGLLISEDLWKKVLRENQVISSQTSGISEKRSKGKA